MGRARAQCSEGRKHWRRAGARLQWPPLRGRLMVGRLTLDQVVKVRVLAPQLPKPPAQRAIAFGFGNCHGAHTCPSDHHTYVWTDLTTGLMWDGAEPSASEYNPS